ncbi:unnamed protein product [Closterium sp. NIES-65]|nr:unnamed protein product [Closterium sp. NIES-65]
MRDAAARLAVRSHMPSVERAHFSQYKTAKTLYDAVAAPYSSPAAAALSRLMLQYLFSDLAAFATVADLITHLRTSDTRYRAALPAEFCAKNPHPMYITLYCLVTRLPDSLRSVRDHFLSLCPTTLTSDLLEERLHAPEKSIVAVGASRGDPRAPFCERCSPVPLLPSVASATAVDLVGTESVSAASAPSRRRRSGRSKGGKGAGGDGEGGGGGGGGGGGDRGGVVAGVGASAAAVEVEAVAAAAVGAEEVAAAVRVVAVVVLVWVALCSGEVLVVASASSSSVLVRPCRPCSFVSGTLGVGGPGMLVLVLTISAPASAVGRRVAIFDLDYDAILAAMYAVTISAEGDCYVCVPPDPGIEAAALGASECAAPGAGESALSGTASAQALHTFTLDSGASRSFFRDCTTLSLLSRLVAVSLADPSGGPVLANSSTVLLCLAVPSGSLSGLHLPSFSTNLVSGADLQDAWVDQFTPGGQWVTHCSCTRTGRHLATFSHQPGSSLYTLTTGSPPLFASGQVAASSQVFAAASPSGPESSPCLCRLLSHQTLLWHHRLGHPSMPRLRGMASHVLVTGLPRSLPPLPPGPAPTCVPCIEGRQRAAPHSSELALTKAPLQTLHMDVWGPTRVRGQGHESNFLLVVDDYSHYTTVFPLRRKGEVTEVLIDWIRAARPQLSESFGSNLPVLHLHSDRVRCHQLNLQPRVSMPETTPTLRWTGKVGDVSAFRVWGSRAFVRDLSADKLSSRAVPCVFLGFPPDAPGWQFYHPTSRRVLSYLDVMFDESVPYYHLFPYRTAPPSPPAALPRTKSSSVLTLVRLGVPILRVPDLGVLSLSVRSLGVLSLGVLSLGLLSLGVRSPRVLILRVWSLEVLSLEVLRVVRPGGSRSLHSSCASGLLGTRAMLLELVVLRALEVLLLVELLGVLEPLVPEVLVMEVLELLGLVVLLELELLEVLKLEVLLEPVLLGVLDLALLELLEVLLDLEVLLELVVL